MKRCFRVMLGLAAAAFAVLRMSSATSICEAKELSSIKIKKIEVAIENLESSARGVQRKGYKEIKYIGEETVPFLAKELQNKSVNFESKVLICDILGDFKAKEAIPGLIYNLKNQSFSVRAAACKALGKIGDPSAIAPLMSMLNSEDPHVRVAAVDGLINFDDKTIPPAVAELLKDGSEDVRKSAITLLDDKLDPGTAGVIREALKQDKSSSVRMIAARALGGLKDDKAVDILMETVTEDPSESVRQESVIALGKIGDKKAVPVLIQALNDDYKDVQLGAAGSLVELTGEDFGRDHDKWAEWYAKQ